MITVKDKSNTDEIACPYCESVLGYSKEDVCNVSNGKGFRCPVCNHEITVEEIDLSHPIYPKNFSSCKLNVFTDKISNEEIQETCDAVFKDLTVFEEKCTCYSITESNKGIVIGIKYDEDDIEIIVAKDYEKYRPEFW